MNQSKPVIHISASRASPYLPPFLLITGGLCSDCFTGGIHPQQPVEPRPRAGGQATLPAARPTGVCLPQVPGPIQPW